ncbi:MAG: hypothetical protein QM817_19830 [Archangium sp.]
MKRVFALALSLVAVAAAAQTAPTTPPPTDSSSTTAPAATTTAAAPNGTAPAATANNPLAKAVQARTPEEQANQSGVQLITTLDHYLGMGTFVDARYYSSLSAYLTVIPQYLFSIGKQRMVASATLRGAFEYTLPDADTGRRWSTFDTALGLSAPAFFRETALTGISFSPSIGLTIPTSLESWNAKMITAFRVGVTASRSVKTVDFRLSVSGSASIYANQFSGTSAPTGEAAQTANTTEGVTKIICRNNETYCGYAGMNPAFSFSAGGQVQWRATGSLLFYVGYTYIRGWRYAANVAVDQYTPKAVSDNGNPVARVGMGSFDRTSAYFGGSYQLNEHYSLDLGVSNVQTPYTIDPVSGKWSPRFPFLSFGTWADNATSIYFTLSAAY